MKGWSKWALSIISGLLEKRGWGRPATEEEMGSVATGTKVEAKRSQAEDWWQPPEAGRGKKRIRPQPLGAELPSQPLDLSPVKVISDFWPLEWEEN